MPPFPEALRYVWNTYWRIRNRRGGNGWSASPIELGDIVDFINLSGMRLAPWEVEIIEALDDTWLASHQQTPEDPA